jgi:hypothetical protein
MAKTPSQILAKTKSADKKDDKDWKKDDDKEGSDKPKRRDGFLTFIAKAKKATAK